MALVSMRDLFPACVDVLRREIAPMHYADLARAAMLKLNLNPAELDPEIVRDIEEDVREKMLGAGNYGSFYVGKPYYMGALAEWFITNHETLFNSDEDLRVPGSVRSGITACYDAVLRAPHMITKVEDNAARWFSLAKGKVIEQHVSDWFRKNWPDNWLPSANEGQYDRPCGYDFKLRIGGKEYRIDVSGPRHDGTFGRPAGGKPKADRHILAGDVGDDLFLFGYVTGEAFTDHLTPDVAKPVSRILFCLNCDKQGIDYKMFRRAAKRRPRA